MSLRTRLTSLHTSPPPKITEHHCLTRGPCICRASCTGQHCCLPRLLWRSRLHRPALQALPLYWQQVVSRQLGQATGSAAALACTAKQLGLQQHLLALPSNQASSSTLLPGQATDLQQHLLAPPCNQASSSTLLPGRATGSAALACTAKQLGFQQHCAARPSNWPRRSTGSHCQATGPLAARRCQARQLALQQHVLAPPSNQAIQQHCAARPSN